MLGVILGHTELAMEQVAPSEPLRGDLEQIRSAAERSANLTRQLLAFARKQTIAPKVLDLNATVESMLKMLRQLIGEDIALVWLPGAGLSPVKVDPSQIDQILANLCVNARDAIGGVGKLTIKTANSTFDDDYCATHAEVVPGEYVKLAVIDDGCGMDKATLEKLFEPFFTTKEVGKGTGLGLATVYGIVKQNNGIINVTSEPDKGTTFEICLPRHETAKICSVPSEPLPGPVARNHETILVVEDEPAILNMTKTILERMGWHSGQAVPNQGDFAGRGLERGGVKG
jgi:signal transduction histidine kinase